MERHTKECTFVPLYPTMRTMRVITRTVPLVASPALSTPANAPLIFPFGSADQGRQPPSATIRAVYTFEPLDPLIPIVVTTTSPTADPNLYLVVEKPSLSSTPRSKRRASRRVILITGDATFRGPLLSMHETLLLPVSIRNLVTAARFRDLAEGSDSLKQCNYDQCHRWELPSDTSRVSRCSGCRLVWYCRASCGKSAWKEHRPHCLYNQGVRLQAELLDHMEHHSDVNLFYHEESLRIARVAAARQSALIDALEERNQAKDVWVETLRATGSDLVSRVENISLGLNPT